MIQDPNSRSGSRREFLKLLTTIMGFTVATPLLSSCANDKRDEYEVDIVLQQSEIYYSPATLTVPRGATVIWLNKSYYSQSATCDPKRAKNGSAASLPEGVPAWDSGLL